MKLGKVEREVLERVVYRRLGARRRDVILGPMFGEDAAVLRPPRKMLAVACDPITGAGEMVGWLAVHVNANDVAVCGAKPSWFSATILLPPGSGEDVLVKLMEEMNRAALELNVGIVTGHTEVAPGVSHPIIAGHMIGVLVSPKPIYSGGGRPGDVVMMSKSAAVEGTAILARDFSERLRGRVSDRVLRRARGYYRRISVVEEALALAERKLAKAMHDPTEGGVLGGVYELAEASRVSFILYEERVPVSRETRVVCEALGCDPLRLISSGVLLAAVPRRGVREAEKLGLKVIGELRSRRMGNLLVRGDGGEERVRGPVRDELWRLIEELG